MTNESVSPEGLVRGIRRWDLVAVTINGIIGAGIFGLPSKVYALIGSYSLIAFEVGWLIWLARLTAFAANCNLMISYLSFFWSPANTGVIRALIIVAVVVALTVLNVVG